MFSPKEDKYEKIKQKIFSSLKQKIFFSLKQIKYGNIAYRP